MSNRWELCRAGSTYQLEELLKPNEIRSEVEEAEVVVRSSWVGFSLPIALSSDC